MEKLKLELPVLNLLRHLFSAEPTKELLKGLGRIDPCPTGDKGSTGLALMLQAIRKNESRIDAWLEELVVEFARLFIGPVNPPAIPYASFYLSEDHSLMSEETLEVRKRYLEAGMALKDLHRVPDDHIGIELEFIYHLTKEILHHGERGNRVKLLGLLRMRTGFLQEHMALWVPLFASQLLECSQEPFYKGAASLLKEFMESVIPSNSE